MTAPTIPENPRLTKFVADQTEAVKLARDSSEKTSEVRIDALNAALSVASYNRDYHETSVEKVIADARKFEEYLRERAV